MIDCLETKNEAPIGDENEGENEGSSDAIQKRGAGYEEEID